MFTDHYPHKKSKLKNTLRYLRLVYAAVSFIGKFCDIRFGDPAGDLRERVVPRDLLCSGSLYMLIFADQ